MKLLVTPGSLTHEFACHSKACAPPPAGHGGSTKGINGGTGNGRAAGSGTDRRSGAADTAAMNRILEAMAKKSGRTVRGVNMNKVAAQVKSGRRDGARPGYWSSRTRTEHSQVLAPHIGSKGTKAGHMSSGSWTAKNRPTSSKLSKASAKLIRSAMPSQYKDMMNRQRRQDALAVTNRARANYGMPPISY